MGLSEAELAERSGCSLERVQELARLGILVPRDPDGPFAATDAHRVRLMQAFEDAGIEIELIARGIEAGNLSYENLALFLPKPAAFSKTYEELADEVGRSPELVRRVVREFGLPQTTSETRLREDDVLVLSELLTVWEEAEDDELTRLARAYGQNIRRLVASDVELASSGLFARLRRSGLTDEEMRQVAGELGIRVMALGERLMLWLRGRHLEHEILSSTVQNTEEYLQELGIAPEREARPPAIAFLDLTGYTALTEERGDEAGADLADRLATLVHEAAQALGGYPVKWLGDGVMFYFPEPRAAVLTGLDLVEQTPATVDVRARVGVNAGRVIFRDGDYFGKTVNVASRIADYARPGEVLVSDEVKESWDGENVKFEPIGPVALKGLRDELTLYAASRAADGHA
ncbi:MAG TPA: adenylate/guanylate cyclase domain-containing protein [Gaiellaceae bacterium]